MRYLWNIFTKRRIWFTAGIVLVYFTFPLGMGLGHMRQYSTGPSFWYTKSYYRSAFLLGWRIRAGGGPTPVFSHYYNQPRYWGKDIPAAYTIILFDPLPGEAEFSLHTAELDYGGLGVYAKDPEAEFPTDARLKLEIWHDGKISYQEDITIFAASVHAPVPGLSGKSWDTNAQVMGGNANEVKYWHNQDAPPRAIWNLPFASKAGVLNADWHFEPGQTYQIRLQVTPKMPELVAVVRLRLKNELHLENIISKSIAHNPQSSTT